MIIFNFKFKNFIKSNLMIEAFHHSHQSIIFSLYTHVFKHFFVIFHRNYFTMHNTTQSIIQNIIILLI